VRNGENDGEGLDHTTTNGRPMNAHARIPIAPENPMREAMTNDSTAVMAHLIEASGRARDGDLEAARKYIAHAIALLRWKPGFGASVTGRPPKVRNAAEDGRIDGGYDLLIKCLRTGEVHGLRMVLLGEGPPTEAPAPAAHRSLSRREAGVLQRMAQGMSNKCIARSLGIAPETVKTHAKAILSKLEARTRAQAVARAEAIGLL
jgi:DNA-binding CsgD family transcriptional regulator